MAVEVAAAAAGEPRAAGGRQGRRRGGPAGGTLVLLLVLGLFAAVLYLGPVYPSTVQQLHLHLRLPQLSDGVSLGVAEAALLMEHGIKRAGHKGGSGSTLSFDVCSGFATQRVALVSGGRTAGLPRSPRGALPRRLHDRAQLLAADACPRLRPPALLCRHNPGCRVEPHYGAATCHP
jgi:hypothetical protein